MLRMDPRVVAWGESNESAPSEGSGFCVRVSGHEVDVVDSLEQSGR
jgi:hypothetical protein